MWSDCEIQEFPHGTKFGVSLFDGVSLEYDNKSSPKNSMDSICEEFDWRYLGFICELRNKHMFGDSPRYFLIAGEFVPFSRCTLNSA